MKQLWILVQSLVKISIQCRDTERNEPIQRLEISMDKLGKLQAKILRRLRQCDKIKQLFNKLKAARARGHRNGIKRIEIPVHPWDDPKTCTEWKTIEVPDEIVDHLQTRNRKHFGQADGTPFTRDPLLTDMGFSIEGKGTDDTLLGKYNTNSLSMHVQFLLQHLKISEDM